MEFSLYHRTDIVHRISGWHNYYNCMKGEKKSANCWAGLVSTLKVKCKVYFLWACSLISEGKWWQYQNACRITINMHYSHSKKGAKIHVWSHSTHFNVRWLMISGMYCLVCISNLWNSNNNNLMYSSCHMQMKRNLWVGWNLFPINTYFAYLLMIEFSQICKLILSILNYFMLSHLLVP